MGGEEILDLIRHYAHRLSKRNAARILYGESLYRNAAEAAYITCRGFRALASWEIDDIEQAIQALLDNHILRLKELRKKTDKLYLSGQENSIRHKSRLNDHMV